MLLQSDTSRATTGMLSDVRKIAALAWPVLIGQLAVIAFGVIDTAMVGRFSATDLAALGLGSSVYISVYIGLTGILGALQPIAGQLFGAERESEIGEETRQAFWLALALTVIGFALLYYPEPLLSLAKAPPALHDRTVDYLRILSFGLRRVSRSACTARSRTQPASRAS